MKDIIYNNKEFKFFEEILNGEALSLIGIKEEIFTPLKAHCTKYAINFTGLINNLLKEYLEAHEDISERYQ